ncbi:zinc ribbon domain-containing protein [Clostridium sp. UBA6640]|uniref:zinc ribbon domain-containing protein n=1 Tax=Clostridium sp. UBA6640 TaxID=1946370 RepID=UPI0025BE9560|nr:zinc ribbon domain-containing protein [Clostridium sp. UBA6640]
MRCEKCNTNLPKGSSFCNKCGASIKSNLTNERKNIPFKLSKKLGLISGVSIVVIASIIYFVSFKYNGILLKSIEWGEPIEKVIGKVEKNLKIKLEESNYSKMAYSDSEGKIISKPNNLESFESEYKISNYPCTIKYGFMNNKLSEICVLIDSENTINVDELEKLLKKEIPSGKISRATFNDDNGNSSWKGVTSENNETTGALVYGDTPGLIITITLKPIKK